jgi:hypothetical protein
LRHLTGIVFATFLISVAVIAIFRPVVIVRWAKRAHPDLRDDDQTVLRIARFVGVGALGVAVFFLFIIVRHLRAKRTADTSAVTRYLYPPKGKSSGADGTFP